MLLDLSAQRSSRNRHSRRLSRDLRWSTTEMKFEAKESCIGATGAGHLVVALDPSMVSLSSGRIGPWPGMPVFGRLLY